MIESSQFASSMLFTNVDPASVKDCIALFRSRTYEAGERIAEEGENCKYLMFIDSGEAAVQKYTSGGEFVTIELLEKGDFFGEEVALEEEGRYRFTLEAVSDITILYISRERFLSLLQNVPELKDNYIRIILEIVRFRGQRIALLSQKSVRQKIAFYLLSLGKKQGNRNLVVLPGSREMTAKLLALPRPSLSRELKLMEEDALIEVKGRQVSIPDHSAMEKLVEER